MKKSSLSFLEIKREKTEFEKNNHFQMVVKFSCIFLLKLDKASRANKIFCS